MSHWNVTAGNTLHAVLLNKWLQRGINLLLVGWLGWLAVSHAMPYFREPAPVSAPPVQLAREIPQSKRIDGQDIAAWHLFGKAGTAEMKKARNTINAPETRLKLELKGIVATDDELQGYAIIQKPDKQEKHFRVKDSVFNLATLEEIYVDRVILLREGKYETLRLPIEFMATDLFMERARKKKAKRIVSDFRHKLINRDGMALIKLFGFDTAYKNGGFIGFTLKVLGEDGARMLEVLGLKEGDLITAVNGKRFAESIEATQSLTKLKDAEEVDVEVERKGVPLFFHFDFDEVERASYELDDDSDAEADRLDALEAANEKNQNESNE